MRVSICSSCQITARYDAALIRMTQPVASMPPPNSPIRSPASAGPTIRAVLNAAELRPTALVTSSGPTISETNDCRTGASNAAPMPKANAMT